MTYSATWHAKYGSKYQHVVEEALYQYSLKDTHREAEDRNIFFPPTAMQRIVYQQETTTGLKVITI